LSVEVTKPVDMQKYTVCRFTATIHVH
jgi:hypothetical protein